VPATAPFLALLGDIGYPHVGGDYQRFLLHLADRPAPSSSSSSDVAPEERGWDRIFVLAGNHEYYKGHYEKVKPIIAGVCAMRPDKLVFLDRTAVRLVRHSPPNPSPSPSPSPSTSLTSLVVHAGEGGRVAPRLHAVDPHPRIRACRVVSCRAPCVVR
jgi:hypothetical protein